MMLCVAVGCAQDVEHYRWQSELDASKMYVERSAGAKKLSCRSTFTEPGCPKLSGQAGISYVRGVGKELGVSDLQDGRATAASRPVTRAEWRVLTVLTSCCRELK